MSSKIYGLHQHINISMDINVLMVGKQSETLDSTKQGPFQGQCRGRTSQVGMNALAFEKILLFSVSE
jgi:hypothetical protein